MTDRPTTSFEPTKWVALGETSVRVRRMGIGTNPLAGLMESISEETAGAVVESAWDERVRFPIPDALLGGAET